MRQATPSLHTIPVTNRDFAPLIDRAGAAANLPFLASIHLRKSCSSISGFFKAVSGKRALALLLLTPFSFSSRINAPSLSLSLTAELSSAWN